MINNTTTQLLFLLVLTMSNVLPAGAQIFPNPIPIPTTIGGNNFPIGITASTHNFDPNGFQTDINLNVPLPTYCYNFSQTLAMTYLGPTVIFTKGFQNFINITNNLPPGINTTVHWHGLNVPAIMDGGPHQVIANGSTWSPTFKVIDPVQTAWYHTHLMDQTTIQVIKGLAGMIIVRDFNDPLQALLPHSYGENDFPIIIQEKGFVLDSTTTPPTATAMIAKEKPGNGPYTLINGVVGGVLHVPPEMVRLRILNGSPRKMFHIGLSTQLENPTNFADMNMIATGGGYIDVPRPIKNTLMSVGDRREFVVDFSQWADGDTIYMSNLPVPYDAIYTDMNRTPTPGHAFMAFVVDDALFPSDPIFTLPSTLVPYTLAPGPVAKDRTKRLMGGSGNPWTIDGTGMNMAVINDTVLVNTKERWKIINMTNQAHPFHIHKVQFQVVEYTGLLGTDSTVQTYTHPNLPDELIGYKDVQLLRKNATMTFEARFDSFPSPLLNTEGLMYHCHILTHEDMSMMHQFVVVDSVDFYTGIWALPGTEELSVFPNPAGDVLYLEGTYSEPGVLRFYDLHGRLIREDERTSPGDTPIQVNDLPKGMIILELTAGGRRYVQKVMLK